MVTPAQNHNERPTWFVGAAFGTFGDLEDQSEYFIQEGIWENGWGLEDPHHPSVETVKKIQPGDRIAIKARSGPQKNGLPFDNRGLVVPGMLIKAIGVVTKNDGDGIFVGVDWSALEPPRRRWRMPRKRCYAACSDGPISHMPSLAFDKGSRKSYDFC